jgi:hypothetical protein
MSTHAHNLSVCLLQVSACISACLGSKNTNVAQMISDHNIKQDRQGTYNVTLRRVNETIVAVESNTYYILVCVYMHACTWLPGRVDVCIRIRAYSLAYPPRNAYAPCCDVISGPSVSTTFFDFIS